MGELNNKIYSKKLREIPGRDIILYENKKMKLTLLIGYSLSGKHYFKYIKGDLKHYSSDLDFDDVSMCRIRLDRPEYLPCDDITIKQYKLNKRDREHLVDILYNRKPCALSDEYPTVYEALVKYQDEIQLSDMTDERFFDKITNYYDESYKDYTYKPLKIKKENIDYSQLKGGEVK